MTPAVTVVPATSDQSVVIFHDLTPYQVRRMRRVLSRGLFSDRMLARELALAMVAAGLASWCSVCDRELGVDGERCECGARPFAPSEESRS